jgi:hypothetical protein
MAVVSTHYEAFPFQMLNNFWLSRVITQLRLNWVMQMLSMIWVSAWQVARVARGTVERQPSGIVQLYVVFHFHGLVRVDEAFPRLHKVQAMWDWHGSIRKSYNNLCYVAPSSTTDEFELRIWLVSDIFFSRQKAKISVYEYSTFNHHPTSETSPQPLLSLIPEVPSLVFPLDFLPPNSLYISLISSLPGLDVASASSRHFSSFSSFGV